MTPTWIFDVLAAIMLTVAAVSAARLVAARPWRRGSVTADVDGAHLLMGIAMAEMLTSSLRTLSDTGWEVIFGVLIVWFALRVVWDTRADGIRALAGGCSAPHLVHSGSMLYMFLATTSAAGMAGMAGMNELPGSSGATMLTLAYPTLAFAFALILIGYSVWDLDQLSGKRYSLATARVALAGIGATDIGTDPGPGSGTFNAQVVPSDANSGTGATVGAAVGETLLSPAVKVGCRVAMGVVMVFIMLIAI